VSDIGDNLSPNRPEITAPATIQIKPQCATNSYQSDTNCSTCGPGTVAIEIIEHIITVAGKNTGLRICKP
jgi:hypothetical protein